MGDRCSKSDYKINQKTNSFIDEQRRKKQIEFLEKRLIFSQGVQAKEHNTKIDPITEKAVQDLVLGGLDEDSAKLAISLIKQRQVSNVSFFF